MTAIVSAGLRPDTREPRYGVFLRPDPTTCWALTQITFALERQFGLVSAGAFPPHATLIGNLAISCEVDELRRALDPVFSGARAIEVHNLGIQRTVAGMFAGTVRCDLHHLPGGAVNDELAALGSAVKAAVLPLSRPVDDYFVTPVADYELSTHLSIVSHETALDPRLADEALEFVHRLGIEFPPSFRAEWYTLVELRADWASRWWEDQSWRHLWSWNVPAG